MFRKERLAQVTVGIGLAAVAVAGSINIDSQSARSAKVEPTTASPVKEYERVDIAALVSSAPVQHETESKVQTVQLVLKPGDTLMGVLLNAGVPSKEVSTASASLKAVLDPRKLKAGQALLINLRPDNKDQALPQHMERLTLSTKIDRMVVVQHQDDERFETQEKLVEHTRRLDAVSGEIATSLYEAALDQRVPMDILLQAYQTLGYAVDFQRDIHAGDAFALAYEIFDDGAGYGLHPGDLVYAALTLRDRTHKYFRYTTTDGFTGFFDAVGRSLETGLMKTPVDGGRLSSMFGKRKHPVLGYTRQHKGLDFAAPRGAPVFAAGDGIVVRRGRNGSFGNYVRLRHNGTYSTAYAHLSEYADGLSTGDRVRQGDVIGFVGATGQTTGPNLHYEVLASGRQVNPMSLKIPPRRTLSGDELVRFQGAMSSMISSAIPNSDKTGRKASEESVISESGNG